MFPDEDNKCSGRRIRHEASYGIGDIGNSPAARAGGRAASTDRQMALEGLLALWPPCVLLLKPSEFFLVEKRAVCISSFTPAQITPS